MKLSLILSSLLVGASLMLSGCSDDSTTSNGSTTTGDATETGDATGTAGSTTDDSTGAGDSTSTDDSTTTANTTVQIEKFTTEMLAGKTFYTYGFDQENEKIDSRENMQFNFSADASSVEAINLQDGTNYGTLPVVINADQLILTTPDGEQHIDFLLTTLDSSLIVYSTWLNYWSTEQQSDGGKVLLETLQNDQKLTIDKLTANPWYKLSWINGSNDTTTFHCDSKITIDSNGTILNTTMDADEVKTTSTYDAKIASGDASDQYFLAANPNLIYYVDHRAYFKNISDVKTFIEKLGSENVDACIASYPAE